MTERQYKMEPLAREFSRKTTAFRKGRYAEPITAEEKKAHNLYVQQRKARRKSRVQDASEMRDDISLHSKYQFKVRNGLQHLITQEERDANTEYHKARKRKQQAASGDATDTALIAPQTNK